MPLSVMSTILPSRGPGPVNISHSASTSLSNFGTPPITAPVPSATSPESGSSASSSVSTPTATGGALKLGPAVGLFGFLVASVGVVMV
jgi:hypothetical protein